MISGRTIILVAIMACLGGVAVPSQTLPRVAPSDFPGIRDMAILIPAIPNLCERAHLEGVITLELHFELGKVVAIDVLSKEFTIPEEEPDTLSSLANIFELKLMRVLREWKSLVGNPFEQELTVRIKSSSELQAGERTYRVRYGHWGVVTDLTLIYGVAEQDQ